jgi:CRP-like cAMP-binding protein
MNDNLKLIKNTGFFNNISNEIIIDYLSNAKFIVKKYNKNNVVHFSGEKCLKLEIILEGIVAIERIDESGKLLTITELYANNNLGGNLLFSENAQYQMTLTCLSPSIILEIDKETLFTLLCNNPPFLRTYLEFISNNATILGDKIKHYVNRSIRECILSYIQYEVIKQKSNIIKITSTKTALAEKIGVQRTSLSRELAKMKKDGLILFDSKTIELL